MTYKVLEKYKNGETLCLCLETNQEVIFSEHAIIEEEVGETFELYED